MTAPRVTVLLAVHDGEPFVGAAVASVLEQTYADLELLVVDDASTDATSETLAAFEDARLRVLRNERNLGQVPSLNRGLRDARGAYVARIDADDRCRATRLARQVDVLDRQPRVALVGTWMDVVDQDDRPYTRLRGRMRDDAEFVHAILVDRYPFGHPSLMYRRDVVLSIGGYDAALAPAEDKDLYRRLALAGHGARVIEEPLVVYRRHERQLSQAQANVQRKHDHDSQERFLAELTGDVALARPLRLLLAGDADAWQYGSRTLERSLRSLAAAIHSRLALGADDAQKLERLVAHRAAVVSSVAWKAGAHAQLFSTPAVARFAASYGGARLLPAYCTAMLTAPLLAPVWRAQRMGVTSAARTGLLAQVRATARRSRLLRWLYARLVGTR